MQFTQVKKILKPYRNKKTYTNKPELKAKREYLPEIFLELEGISDLAKDMWNTR
jgi:hypothetical protein